MSKNSGKAYTLQDLLTIETMYEAGKTYAEIAEALGRGVKGVKSRVAKFGHKAHGQPFNGWARGEYPHKPPPTEVLQARDVRRTAPYRDLTAALMGDPPKGYSALDKMEN